MSSPFIVYFSTISNNTHKFVEKLDIHSVRIPLDPTEDLLVDRPYVLITPTYGGVSNKRKSQGVIPQQVIKFLNNNANRALIRGVIAAGNTNFGADYGLAGDIISQKCSTPYLYRFELIGTQEDVFAVQDGLTKLWESSTDDIEVA